MEHSLANRYKRYLSTPPGKYLESRITVCVSTQNTFFKPENLGQGTLLFLILRKALLQRLRPENSV